MTRRGFRLGDAAERVNPRNLNDSRLEERNCAARHRHGNPQHEAERAESLARQPVELFVVARDHPAVGGELAYDCQNEQDHFYAEWSAGVIFRRCRSEKKDARPDHYGNTYAGVRAEIVRNLGRRLLLHDTSEQSQVEHKHAAEQEHQSKQVDGFNYGKHNRRHRTSIVASSISLNVIRFIPLAVADRPYSTGRTTVGALYERPNSGGVMKWIYACSLVVALAACSAPTTDKPAAEPVVAEIKSPAGPHSGEVNLSTGSDGQMYLSWVEHQNADEYAFRFSTRKGQEEWSAPQTIAQGKDWFVSPADYPLLVPMADGTLAAAWFIATELETESYDIKLAFSRDKGATWSNPISPHRDTKKRQHGFPSLVPTADNQLAAVWLDGRNLPEDFIGDMALMYTTVASDGTLGKESELDTRVCECCRTSAAATPDGLVAVYRDRSDKEVRDISIVRMTNGVWSKPEPLSTDNWEITGCPVNGPAVSSNGRNVAVAWFTAPNEQAKTNVVLSTDGGKTFGQPIKIDEGNPIGHVDIMSLPSGGAIVSWIERTANGPRVRLREIDSKGVAGKTIAVSDVAAMSDGVTQIEGTEKAVIVAWTDAEDMVRTTAVNLR
jgi:hypothetical protein